MEEVKRVIKLAKQREKLFEQWRHELFMRGFDKGNKLYDEMEAIDVEIKTMIGRKPSGVEYSEWASMVPGSYFGNQFQMEVDRHKARI